MEKETATFFINLDKAIKKLRDGKEDECPGPQGLGGVTKTRPPQRTLEDTLVVGREVSLKRTVCHFACYGGIAL